MKNIIFFSFLLVLTSGLYAQNYAYTASVNGDKATLNQALASNYIEFVMPNEVNKSTIENSSSSYTDVFTVAYNETTRIAKINFIQNDFTTRLIVVRFLFSANIGHVNFNQKSYETMTFFNKFMR